MKTIAELKTLSQWVGYTSNKVPMCPHTGGAASSNNPDTWATAAQAWSAKKRYGWAGIGYVFTIGAGVVGVDLDDCFDDAGRLSDDARQIMQLLNSYTERSPSGKGLHILACGSIPNSVKKPGFEMYNELRYFTVTGNQYGASEFSCNDIEDRQGQLEALFAVYDDFEQRSIPVKPRPVTAQTTDEAEIAKALSHIPAQGDYNTDWLPILMAVHDALPDDRGVALVESWSPGYPGEVARKFRSFDRTAKGGITIATLFGIAKRYGYQPAKTNSTPRPPRRGADITDALAQRTGRHATA